MTGDASRSLALLALAAAGLALATCVSPEPASRTDGAARSDRVPAAGAPAPGTAAPGAARPAGVPEADAPAAGAAADEEAARAAAVAAWDVVYGVLQHPRCANCHPPAGSGPLQGDAMEPHAQLVQRGPTGHGVFGMRCDTCHQAANLPGEHLPPGSPNWHLPEPDVPLVFVGMGRRELCEQLRDPARNGGKTPEQLFVHMAADALVLWGWDPGPGRAPVSTPHAELVSAMRTWVDNDCGCPAR